jgi:hypothetical protein
LLDQQLGALKKFEMIQDLNVEMFSEGLRYVQLCPLLHEFDVDELLTHALVKELGLRSFKARNRDQAVVAAMAGLHLAVRGHWRLVIEKHFLVFFHGQ